MEPESYFAYRWHPYPIDQAANYSAEPTTQVEFRLAGVEAGTLFATTESGFDQIPVARRA